jgi:hypothetical protein
MNYTGQITGIERWLAHRGHLATLIKLAQGTKTRRTTKLVCVFHWHTPTKQRHNLMHGAETI